jgi:3-methyladenine DNA glycosylase/8-oxoguanine DNA glycosylase
VTFRDLQTPSGFSLAQTCGPVAWAKGRWPTVDWIDGCFVWVGWEREQVVARTACQAGPQLLLKGGSPDLDLEWANRILGLNAEPPQFADERMAALQSTLPGLRPYANGSIFEGLITSIVGQSISVAGAAVTERKLNSLFHPGIEAGRRRYWPMPLAGQLADSPPELIRQSGVTWRRAEAIVAVARAELDGRLPTNPEAAADSEAAREKLRALPLVGPWTAESTLLWGIGQADAHPTGDVALLRAARTIFDLPDLTLKTLDHLAESWRPWRGWAARYLWTALLGTAEGSTETSSIPRLRSE